MVPGPELAGLKLWCNGRGKLVQGRGRKEPVCSCLWCVFFFLGSGVGSVLLWQCANARVVLAVERVFDMYEKEERVFIKVEG